MVVGCGPGPLEVSHLQPFNMVFDGLVGGSSGVMFADPFNIDLVY